MPKFSARSAERLASCDPRLQALFERVVEGFDCTVLEGQRSAERQALLFEQGATKIREGGKHTAKPSLAVDVAPYPVDWEDAARFHVFGGYVLATARALGLRVRWGGDWDRDTEVKDETFRDLVHFELEEDA